VAEAVTIGTQDALRTQKIVSCVAVESASGLTTSAIAEHCAQHLSRERQPAEIRIIAEMPRNAAGKINLDQVAELFEGSAATEPAAGAVSVYSWAAKCFKIPAETLSADSTPFNTEGWDSL
jgi:acyl-coenzyme A synthetase/AMP-(fatty) acid ligase